MALGNTVQQDTLTVLQAVIDTWGKRCSQIVMFGNVPDIKVDNISFRAIKHDHADSWKALSSVLSQVIAFLSLFRHFETCFLIHVDAILMLQVALLSQRGYTMLHVRQ